MVNAHGVIQWYEPVHETVSYLPEVIEEIKQGANALARQARDRLDMNRLEGDAHIEVIHRRQPSQFAPPSLLDSYVLLVATDEYAEGTKREKGWPAAMSIEMGADNGGGGVGPLRGAANDLAQGVKQR